MSTCVVVDTVDWVDPNCVSVGDTGFGVLGSSVPSTGTNGPGYAYPFLSLPTDAGKEVCGRITTWPAVDTIDPDETTAFTVTPPADGTDTFQFQLYLDGVASGPVRTIALVSGTTGGAVAPGATLTSTESISGGAASSSGNSTNGTAPGANLTSTSGISAGWASVPATVGGATLTSTESISGGAASVVIGPLPVSPNRIYRPGEGFNFPDILAGDIETLTFDFTNELPPGVTITGATPHFATHVGTDDAPNDIVDAGPTVDGAFVSVRIAPTVAGVAYWPRVTAACSDGQRITLPEPGEGSIRVVA